MNKPKNTLPPAVQRDLDRIVAAPTITLHKQAIEVIAAYRKTKAAYDQAVTTADAHTDSGVWTRDNLSAVEEALKTHQQSELHMAILFAGLAAQAGI